MDLIFSIMRLHLARPKQKSPVLPIPGLTNFSAFTVKAFPLTLIEKFSAGNFCYFLLSKSKKPVWPRQKHSEKAFKPIFYEKKTILSPIIHVKYVQQEFSPNL
jgi:hypothetical protein